MLRQLYRRIPRMKLMDVCNGVSLRQMCNEACFVSVTFERWIAMEGHLTGSGVSLLIIHSSVLRLARPKNKAWKESWAHDEGPWSLLPLQPRPASPKLK